MVVSHADKRMRAERTAFFSSSQTRSWFFNRSGCQDFFIFKSPPPILNYCRRGKRCKARRGQWLEMRCAAGDDSGWRKGWKSRVSRYGYPQTSSQPLYPKVVRRPTMSTDPDRERFLDNDELDSPEEPMFVPVLPLSMHDILRLTNIRTLVAQPGRYTP